ncbi:hypothetical protein ACIBEF_22325 [Micromonospora sp. NPDC050795]|uniref:hypothetical protein n=1 Tax=Micromonospora sp. NPDC050795 TaxID=3364282 RepID=UPI00379CF12E
MRSKLGFVSAGVMLLAAVTVAQPQARPATWQHRRRIKLKNCPLNKGASGGPFLRAWDNDLRFGYVNSVMSYKYSGNMYGPYFDDDVMDIYNVAKNKQ